MALDDIVNNVFLAKTKDKNHPFVIPHVTFEPVQWRDKYKTEIAKIIWPKFQY